MSMYSVNPSIPKTLVRYLVKYVAQNESNTVVSETLMDIIEMCIRDRSSTDQILNYITFSLYYIQKYFSTNLLQLILKY